MMTIKMILDDHIHLAAIEDLRHPAAGQYLKHGAG